MKIWIVDRNGRLGVPAAFDNEHDTFVYASALHKPTIDILDVPEDHVRYCIDEVGKDGDADRFTYDWEGLIWSDIPSRELAQEAVDAMLEAHNPSGIEADRVIYMIKVSLDIEGVD